MELEDIIAKQWLDPFKAAVDVLTEQSAIDQAFVDGERQSAIDQVNESLPRLTVRAKEKENTYRNYKKSNSGLIEDLTEKNEIYFKQLRWLEDEKNKREDLFAGPKREYDLLKREIDEVKKNIERLREKTENYGVGKDSSILPFVILGVGYEAYNQDSEMLKDEKKRCQNMEEHMKKLEGPIHDEEEFVNRLVLRVKKGKEDYSRMQEELQAIIQKQEEYENKADLWRMIFIKSMTLFKEESFSELWEGQIPADALRDLKELKGLMDQAS